MNVLDVTKSKLSKLVDSRAESVDIILRVNFSNSNY